MQRSLLILVLIGVSAVSRLSPAATNLFPANTPPPSSTPVVNPDHAELQWARATNEVSFRVYAGVSTLVQKAYISREDFVLTDLDPDTYYQWRIDAYDENRSLVGSRGTAWTFKTGPADPRKTHTPVPANGSTITNGQDSVLRWSAGSVGGSFNVYFGKDSSPDETEFRGNLSGNPVELSYFAGILEPNKQYYWRIDTVVDLNGTVVPGHVWTFRIDYGATNYPNTNTILYADEFENGAPDDGPVGWSRQNSQARLAEVAGRTGKSAWLGQSTWIERAISTDRMKDLQIQYRRALTNFAEGESFMCQWSTNGADWQTVLAENTGEFSDPLKVVNLSAAANRQPGFRIRFVSDAAGTNNCAYLDQLQVRGVYSPNVPARNPQHDIQGATVLFLGDSLTSNNGSLRDNPDKEHWTDQVAQRFALHVLTAHAYDLNDNSIENRLLNHGKGGSRAFLGEGADPPVYYGDDAASPNLGGYQRLKYAFQEIHQGLYGMVQPTFVLINFSMNDHKRVWKSGVSTGVSTPQDFNQQLKLLVDFVRTNGAIPILVTTHDFFLGTPDDLDSYSYSFDPELYNNAEDDYSALGRFHHFLDETRRVAEGSPAEGRAPVDLIEINRPSSDYDPNEFTVTGGVHLDKLGHDTYAQVIGDWLSAGYGDGSLAPPPPPAATNCPPPAQPPPVQITGSFVLTQSGCWTAGENWNNKQPPSETNLVYIRSGLTASIAYDAGVIRRFYLGDNSSTYPPGTGTLNIVPGGQLVTSLDAPEVGRQRVPGPVGSLNLSGGMLQIGTSSNYVLKVGIDSAGFPVTGNVIVTGGEFRGRFLIGSSGVPGATPDLLRIVGDAAVIGSAAGGNGLEVCESGTVEYVFNSTGISGMAFPNGAGVFHPSSRLIVDGADYEGGATTFELLRCSSFSGTPVILLENCPPGTSYNWNGAGGSFTITLGQATRPALQYRLSSAALELKWANSFLGWYAQSNAMNVADPSGWFDISGSQAVTNLSVVIKPGMTNVHYRLRKP